MSLWNKVERDGGNSLSPGVTSLDCDLGERSSHAPVSVLDRLIERINTEEQNTVGHQLQLPHPHPHELTHTPARCPLSQLIPWTG